MAYSLAGDIEHDPEKWIPVLGKIMLKAIS
jgi:hypothetical protein